MLQSNTVGAVRVFALVTSQDCAVDGVTTCATGSQRCPAFTSWTATPLRSSILVPPFGNQPNG